jgi:2',3'-cyclic-nucleotide 2'-phosphodiesterase (5'-nucleotidase family)
MFRDPHMQTTRFSSLSQPSSVLYKAPVHSARQGRIFPKQIPDQLQRMFTTSSSDKNVLRFWLFNDVYKVPPLAQLYTLLEKELKNDPNLGIFFGGDLLYASVESQKTKGSHMVDAMNVFAKELHGRMIAVLGNHEFDGGLDNLFEQVKRSRFSWLAANLYKNERRLKETPPYKIIKINGKRILVYGIVIRDVGNKLPDNVHLKDPLEQVRAELPDLIKKRRPDMVVLLGHLGKEHYDAIQELPIDLALLGHEHDAMLKDQNGVHLLCADADLESFGRVSVFFKEPPRLIERLLRLMSDTVRDEMPPSNVKDIQTEIVPILENTPEHPDVLGAIAPEIAAWTKSLETPLALLGGDLNLNSKDLRRLEENPAGNFLTDAFLEGWNQKHPEKKADVAMLHAGSFRANEIIPHSTVLTERHLKDNFPYPDPAVRIEANKQLIKSILEESLSHFSSDDRANKHPGYFMNVSGLRIEVDMSKPFGERVITIHKAIDNQPLGDDEPIYLLMYHYLTTPEGGLSSLADYVKENPQCIKQKGGTFDAYIQHHLESIAEGSTLPTISPKTDGRWDIK